MNVFTPNVAYYVMKYERMKGSGYVDTVASSYVDVPNSY
jgi:hypothetical protein